MPIGEKAQRGGDIAIGRLGAQDQMQRAARGTGLEPGQARFRLHEHRVEDLGRIAARKAPEPRLIHQRLDLHPQGARGGVGGRRCIGKGIAGTVQDLGEGLDAVLDIAREKSGRRIGLRRRRRLCRGPIAQDVVIELELAARPAPGFEILEDQDRDGLPEIGRRLARRHEKPGRATWQDHGATGQGDPVGGEIAMLDLAQRLQRRRQAREIDTLEDAVDGRGPQDHRDALAGRPTVHVPGPEIAAIDLLARDLGGPVDARACLSRALRPIMARRGLGKSEPGEDDREGGARGCLQELSSGGSE